MRSILIACVCAVSMLALAASAHAATLSSLTVGTNTANSPTSTVIDTALVQGTQTIDDLAINLPTSLAFNWSAISSNLCPTVDVYGDDPVGDCPATSFFGTAGIHTPLVSNGIDGDVIAFDTGGSLPGLAVFATDASESIDSRTYFNISAPPTVSGSVIQLMASDISDPPLDQISLYMSGSSAGQFFKVQPGAYCHASDAIDATVITDAGYTSFGTGPAVSFSGCGNGGWITSGPATGDIVSNDTVTFNYQNNGGTPFTKFRCGLVSLTDPNNPSSELVDCGTNPAGASKTYSGLRNGAYAFRVYKYPSGGGTDLRKFEVRRPAIAVNNGTANTGTALTLSTAVGTGGGYLSDATLRLPTSLGINWSALGSGNVCSSTVAYQPDPQDHCPNAVFGSAELFAQGGTIYPAHAIIVDSGGSLPMLMIYADLGGTEDWRATFDISDRNSGAGNVLQLTTGGGDLADETPSISRLDINLTGGTSGHPLKVRSGAYCYSPDTLDTTIETTASATVNSIASAAAVFSGCSTGGLITSGPATGSVGNSSSVTFNYSYGGSGSFSKFRCSLVKLSNPSAVGTTVDCGTVKTGSSKTYTGLTNGVYQFRVNTTSTTVYDMRKFKVGS